MPISDGPPLWKNLPIEDCQALIKFSAGELARCYAQRELERAREYSYNHALEMEIQFFERAHDSHFSWLRARERETNPLGLPERPRVES